MDNPHVADWWFSERFKVWQEFVLGRETDDAQWRWDRFEGQSRSIIDAYGCSSWNTEPSGRLTDLSRMFLRGFLQRRRRVEGEGQGRDEGASSDDISVSDEEYKLAQVVVLSFLGDVGATAQNPDTLVDGVPIDEDQQ